jgi:putative membrane protein
MKCKSIATYAIAGAAIFALLAAPARAQGNASAGAGGPTAASPADQQFVTQAIQANDQEIDEARAELNSTNDPNVKMFAQRMIDDHTVANSQLGTIASQLNLKYPKSHIQSGTESNGSGGTPPPAAANSGSNMAALPPSKYMQQEVQDHQQAVALYEGESKNGTAPLLRTYAATTLPQLRAHLAMAQQYTNTGRITPVQTPKPPANGMPPH